MPNISAGQRRVADFLTTKGLGLEHQDTGSFVNIVYTCGNDVEEAARITRSIMGTTVVGRLGDADLHQLIGLVLPVLRI